MQKPRILDLLSEGQIQAISEYLAGFFPVHSQRISELILQTNSIDKALQLLMIHKNSDSTLDLIVYDYMLGRDNDRY